MTPTIFLVRIDGHGTEHLSLHASERGAGEAMLRVGGDVWADRFGSRPAADATPLLVRDWLDSEGYRAFVGPVEVEL